MTIAAVGSSVQYLYQEAMKKVYFYIAMDKQVAYQSSMSAINCKEQTVMENALVYHLWWSSVTWFFPGVHQYNYGCIESRDDIYDQIWIDK